MNTNSILIDNLRICNLHKRSIISALMALEGKLPLTLESLKFLNEQEKRAIDQFLFRFSKLQDFLGGIVFRNLLYFLNEPITSSSTLDILYRLEALGIIEDIRVWGYLRECRNNIAHEYDDDNNTLYESLNQIFESWQKLDNVLISIENYIKSKIEMIDNNK